jgi:hypothetical protein
VALSAAVSTLAIARAARAEFDGPIVRALEGGEDFWLAQEAYIYGYPLVTMEMTRRIMTNVASPEGTRGPMGQFKRDIQRSVV